MSWFDRGAADALLSPPGAPVMVGLESAATALLDAVDVPLAPAPPAPASGKAASGGDVARLVEEPPADHADASGPPWTVQRMRDAAGALRGQLKRPGGYHGARPAGIAERLMGVELGGA
ncbi:hypothetical protein [Streptomyces sp. MMBL 11-3]|uniref:hypothetical protein n=1 Tax=Streptomyces sp. MMBL 11-3 TaxID=3382639 RepID=UPI0039B45B38